MGPQPEVRYADSQGLSIAYSVLGDGPVDLLVVPGFVSNLDLLSEMPPFGPMVERLTRYARCLVLDKRGVGLSDRNLGFGSLEERMDDLRAVLDHAGWERTSIFAYSEGGPLSLLFAAAYPDRVSKLAIYGSAARLLRGTDYPEGFPPELVEPFVGMIESQWGTGSALDPFVQPIPDSDSARRLVARYERGACTPAMAAHIVRANTEIDVRAMLPSVRTPTLVLHSSGDPLFPVEHGERMAQLLPDATLETAEVDYHMPWNGDQAWFHEPLAEFLTGERDAAATTDRFLATLLLTDIVDSTVTASRLGDEEWRGLLERHHRLTAETVSQFGGQVVKSTGDGMLATFPGPSHGVACGRAVTEAVERLGLQVRAGVHTGEVERFPDDVGGIGVHIATRVAEAASAGEVWVSRTVRDLTAGSGLEFETRGSHRLKGLDDAWELYSLS